MKSVRCCLSFVAVLAVAVGGCKPNGAGSASAPSGTTNVRLTLDWKPEPEFGGFYAAQANGTYAKHQLNADLKIAGEGANVWQLVDRGQTDFGTTAADQVLIARAAGADVVALFAVYQTSPQAIMVHRARGFKKLEDVFTHSGILAAEPNTWLSFLLSKYQRDQGKVQVKVIGYAGGIAAFLAKPDYSQQCFVTSEPIQAAQQGSDPQTFLVAEAGYDPYTTVVIARGKFVREHPQTVKQMIDACGEGWRAYLDDPAPTNAVMAKLNKDMDAQTFARAAAAQKPLIEDSHTAQFGLGSMSKQRWEALAQQLVALGVIKKAPPAEQCFIDPDKLPER